MNPVLAYRTLCAFTERGSRWFAVLVWSLFGIPAMFAARYTYPGADHVQSGAAMPAAFFGIAAGFVWFAFPNQGIRLAREARGLAMPGWVPAMRAAFAGLFAVTVLLPALELAWFTGGEFPLWFGVIASGAFIGMLASLVNYWLVVYCLPVFYVIDRLREAFHVDFDQAGPEVSGWAMAGLAIALGTVCAWRWIQQTRAAHVTAFVRSEWATQEQVQHGLTRLDPARRLGPVQAMAVWLGPSIGSRLVPALLNFLFVLAVVWLTFGIPPALRSDGGLLASLWVFLGYAAARMSGPWLKSQFQPGRHTLAELALLPGWGAAAAARRTLLLAALRPAGLALSAGVAVIAAFSWLHGAGAGTFVAMAGLAAALAATCAASCLAVLAWRRPGKDLVLATAVPFAILFALLRGRILLAAAAPVAAGLPALAACGLWALLMGSVAWLAWRRVAARPHPFLTA